MASSPTPRQEGPSSAIQVTYTAASSSFLDSPLCSHILSSIASQLPLRNVHHRPSATGGNTTVKTIQTLPVRLVPLADEQLKAKHKPETRHLVQANLLERPFVHIFLVATADSDAYRTQIRNEIRTWINDLKETPTLSAIPKSSGPQPALPSGPTDDDSSTSAKDKEEDASPEYLIVYVTPPAGAGGAPGSSAGYFDRSPSASSNSLPATGSPSTPLKDDAAGTPSTAAKTGMGRFLSSSSTSSSKDPTGGVLDKLKTDFGGGKKSERIVHIARLPASSNSSLAQFADPTIFADLLTALRQSVASTFDLAIKAQRDEAVKLKSLRSVRGWNPVGVFGKIECLANTYESIGLHDEALRCFEELDDLYEDCLREGDLTWFPSIAPTSLSEGEDSTSVLSPTAKPYREMILHSSASLWELKKYLLARRLMLLSKMGRGLAVMREAMAWLAEMRTMVAEQDLPPHCLSAFSISVCLDIVHHCQHLFLSPSGVLTSSLPSSTYDDTIKPRVTDLDRLPASFHSLSGDVLGVALDQVHKIGVGFQYMPAMEPFVSAADSAKAVKTRETTGVTRTELLKAVEDEESFDAFYTSLAERTLDALARGGRTRSTRRIQIALASLDLHRNRIEKAHRSFSTLLESFSERTSATWPSIERLLLRRQLECHARLGKPKNRGWVASVVNLLRTMPSHGRDGLSAPAEDRSRGEDDGWGQEAELFAKLRAASMDFEKEVPVSGFGKLALIAGSTRATLLDDEDGVKLPVVVFSSLLGDLHVDDARFCLVGGGQKYQREQYWLTSGPLTLKPGRNEVMLRSTASAPGTFVLDVSQIRLGRIVFQYVAPKTVPGASSNAPPGASSTPTLVRVPADGAALDAALEQPDLIALDQPRNAHLVVRSGRNKVARAVLRVRHIADTRPLMGFGAGEVAAGGGTPGVEPTEDGLGLELTNVEPWTETTIVFPLDEPPPADGSAMPLIIDVEYHTAGGSSSSSKGSAATTKRLFRKRADLHTALPLGVNVQDFFRLDCLLCKFSISTGSGSTLKVKRADLVQQSDAPDGSGEVEESEYSIAGPPQFKASARAAAATVAVTPRQPVAYVFKIARRRAGASGTSKADSAPPSPSSATSLRLSIVYRTLHEDAKVQLAQMLSARLEDRSEGDTKLSRGTSILFSRALAEFADEHLDTVQYAATGAIRFRLPSNSSSSGGGGGATQRTAILSHWQKSIVAGQWGLSALSEEGKACLEVLRDVLAAAARCGPLARVKAGEASDGEDGDQSTWRTLEIPVEVPQMDIVNCVRVVPVREHQSGTATAAGKRKTTPSAIVGQALPIEVHIESTLHWGSRRHLEGDEASGEATTSSSLPLPSSGRAGRGRRSSSPSATSRAGGGGGGEADTDAGSVFEDAVSATGGSDTTEKNAGAANGAAAAAGETAASNEAATGGQRMHYEVQADFDSWIVSGPRRGVFHLPLVNSSARTTTTTTVARTWLIPLRAGSLSMPSVAVWPLREAPTEMPASLAHGGGGAGGVGGGRRGAEDGAGAQQEPLPTCETYVANVAERVEVVEGGAGGGEEDEEEEDEEGQVLYGDDEEDQDALRQGRMRSSRRETFLIDAGAMAV